MKIDYFRIFLQFQKAIKSFQLVSGISKMVYSSKRFLDFLNFQTIVGKTNVTLPQSQLSPHSMQTDAVRDWIFH